MTQNNEPFIFTSERLGYRLLRESDFDDYLLLDSDAKVRAFFPSGTLNAEQVKTNIKKNMDFFMLNGFGVFIAIELLTGEFVGRCGFGAIPSGEIEVGYVFLPKFWGKGLATEALITLLKWAKQKIHSVDEIIAFTPINHLASQRVIHKAGMEFYKKDLKDEKECLFYKKHLR
ncbi:MULTISPECIES: GNAT family N-acetyltransferase [Legionella]|uniref:GNAT family N-acetyltransferase n=1 Tax=Legionella resiliens TaxID=2905958 RepID=A0ABS8X2W2_9GAMM|nr:MULTISPECIES: GNAT family N-acetyltransferase [unclassified Legionella]MCE0723038.1 GNAT family N-acetyltransferase [Legionella sp. 9fVS26]MCE3532191.1 GNAT family N-acetyltransferase [Legionella sp. 8cVS16]QLZ68318.1 N-acetyltransferase [Legionella sp. PC1000]